MIEKNYQPADIEGRMSRLWEEAGAFKAGRPERRDAQPFTIVIPPPNVTGSLHMGHALNNTLQDILCRFERMRGRDVLELTDEMAVPAAPQPAFRKVEPQDDLEFTETAAARAIQRQPLFQPPPVFEGTAAPPAAAILSRTTVSAVESAFNTLAHTVLSNNARTLEDLVKEMLRPMLKSWLDDNLPGLVERIVKAEIERVSRGGR